MPIPALAPVLSLAVATGCSEHSVVEGQHKSTIKVIGACPGREEAKALVARNSYYARTDEYDTNTCHKVDIVSVDSGPTTDSTRSQCCYDVTATCPDFSKYADPNHQKAYEKYFPQDLDKARCSVASTQGGCQIPEEARHLIEHDLQMEEHWGCTIDPIPATNMGTPVTVTECSYEVTVEFECGCPLFGCG